MDGAEDRINPQYLGKGLILGCNLWHLVGLKRVF